MKRERVTISFLPSDYELVLHLKAVRNTRNISNYLRDLIRKDMNGNWTGNDIEKIILTLANTIGKETSTISKNPPPQNAPHIVIEDRNLIKNLF